MQYFKIREYFNNDKKIKSQKVDVVDDDDDGDDDDVINIDADYNVKIK